MLNLRRVRRSKTAQTLITSLMMPRPQQVLNQEVFNRLQSIFFRFVGRMAKQEDSNKIVAFARLRLTSVIIIWAKDVLRGKPKNKTKTNHNNSTESLQDITFLLKYFRFIFVSHPIRIFLSFTACLPPDLRCRWECLFWVRTSVPMPTPTAKSICERRLAAQKTVRNFSADRRLTSARRKFRQRTKRRFRPSRPCSDDHSKPSAQSVKIKMNKIF